MNESKPSLREQVEAENAQRLQAFVSDYTALVERHGCDLRALPIITQDGRIDAQIQPVITDEG